jgi:hypothetical protein
MAKTYGTDQAVRLPQPLTLENRGRDYSSVVAAFFLAGFFEDKLA